MKRDRVPGRALLCGAGAAVSLMLAMPVNAQERGERPVSRSAAANEETTTVGVALRRVREAYAREPWGERVRLVVRDERGAARGSTYVVRYARSEGDEKLQVDLGRLRIFTDGTEVIAVTPSAGEVAFRREFELGGRSDVVWAMRQVFPPVAMPQVVAAGLSDDAIERAASEPLDLFSIVGPVKFETAAAEDRGRLVVLRGNAEAADVTLSIIAETGRLRDAVIAYPRPEGGGSGKKIEMTFSRVSPGDPVTWKPSIEGKRLVESPAMLTPRRTVFEPGENVERVPLMDLEGRAVSLGEKVKRELGSATFAFIFTRIPPEAMSGDAKGAAAYPDLWTAWELLDDMPRTAVLVSTLEDAALVEKIQTAIDAVPDKIRDTGEVLWASSPEGTIDRFAPEAETVIVLVGSSGVLLDVINADAMTESEEMKRRIEQDVNDLDPLNLEDVLRTRE